MRRFLPLLFFLAVAAIIASPMIIGAAKKYSYSTIFEEEAENSTPYFFDNFTSCSQYSTPITSAKRNDLSAWKDAGIITVWLDIENSSSVDRVDLKLTDGKGSTAVLKGIDNLHLQGAANVMKRDDPFPEAYFNDNQSNRKWEDYMLIDGTTLLFYEYNESPGIDMSDVTAYELLFTPGNATRAVLLEDIRVQSGLTRYKNPTDGVWYSPNGLPQYGIFWCDSGWIMLRNVRQGQYPSNGDHTRIISSVGTPENFVMRVRFKITDVKNGFTTFTPQWVKSGREDPRKNTYFRIAWDFENEWDPGHNQSIAFFSFEYNKFGLQKVYPKVRYFRQGYEPQISSGTATADIELRKDKVYEANVLVRGQDARAAVYEVHDNYYWKLGEVGYTFATERPDKEFPFSFEFTGNIKGQIDLIEIRKM